MTHSQARAEETSETAKKSLTPEEFDSSLKLGYGALMRTLIGHQRKVTSVAITPDNLRSLSASDDRTIKVWHLENGTEMMTLSGHNDWVRP